MLLWYTQPLWKARYYPRWALLANAVLVWTASAVLTVLYALFMAAWALPARLIDPQNPSQHAIAGMWGRALMRCHPGWRLEVLGRRHLHPARTYVLVANHQSLLDIAVLYALRRQFKWVAKAELFSIPFLGWAMSLAGYIKLARGRHGSIRETYEEAKRWLAQGMSVLFFPEGTRSYAVEGGPFKDGTFKLAVEQRVPLAPIVIDGTRGLLPRRGWVVNPMGRIRLTVLSPIEVSAYEPEDDERLRDDVRRLMEQALGRS